MLEKVRLALRVSTKAFDAELLDLIAAAMLDLGIVVDYCPETDPLIIRAVVTYCKIYFGSPDDRTADRLKKAYDEQKAQLSTCSRYREWSAINGQIGDPYSNPCGL